MRGGFAFGGMALEARLYAAVLRYFFLLFGTFVLSGWSLARLFHVLPMRLGRDTALLAGLLLTAFSVVLFVRCGLLLPALAVYRKRRVLRGAWALSRGRFWRLAAIVAVAVAAPVVAVQAVGEILSYQLVSPVAVHGAQSLFHAADTLATDIGALVAIVL